MTREEYEKIKQESLERYHVKLRQLKHAMGEAVLIHEQELETARNDYYASLRLKESAGKV